MPIESGLISNDQMHYALALQGSTKSSYAQTLNLIRITTTKKRVSQSN